MMRILVAYDGSDSSESAVAGLASAGLPSVGEATVLVIDDGRFGPQAESEGDVVAPVRAARVQRGALELVEQGRARLQHVLPRWLVRGDVRVGVPAWAILARADAWRPELIVVGAGDSEAGDLGEVSGKILLEARCSVRLGRPDSMEGARRLLVALDGSEASMAAAHAVAARTWPIGSAVRIVGVLDGVGGNGSQRGAIHPSNFVEIERCAREASGVIAIHEIPVDSRIRHGDPARSLLEEAAEWGATDVFVGAVGSHAFAHEFLGGVALSLAARAGCTVEVIRVV